MPFSSRGSGVPPEFLRKLEQRQGQAAVGQLNVADLYLVACAVKGDNDAIAEVDRRLLAACAVTLSRWKAPALELEELAQRMRERLFVSAPGKPPRLSAYAGKGALAKWLQVVAATLTIGAQRSQRRAGEQADGDEDLALVAATGANVDVQLSDAGNKRAFTRAFKSAVGQLPARDRTVMRLRYVDQCNLDEIAAMYKVHRTTVMRWLEQAQAAVHKKTREELSHELGVRGPALDSVIRKVDLSFVERVSRLLQASEAASSK